MVTISLRSSGLHHVLGAIGSLSLFVLTGLNCGGGATAATTSTLAPIMATGPANGPSTSPLRVAAQEQKCSRK